MIRQHEIVLSEEEIMALIEGLAVEYVINEDEHENNLPEKIAKKYSIVWLYHELNKKLKEARPTGDSQNHLLKLNVIGVELLSGIAELRLNELDGYRDEQQQVLLYSNILYEKSDIEKSAEEIQLCHQVFGRKYHEKNLGIHQKVLPISRNEFQKALTELVNVWVAEIIP